MSPAEFFAGHQDALVLFERVRDLIEKLGGAEEVVTRSQVAFRRRRAFAWVWRPGQYLRGKAHAPLVLSVALPRRDGSPRWKEIVEPRPARFMHHLEVRAASDLDDEVAAWLREAWESAG